MVKAILARLVLNAWVTEQQISNLDVGEPFPLGTGAKW
jgi:hypothetical protein